MKRKIITISICLTALIIAWESLEFGWGFLLHYFNKVWSIEVNVAFYIWVASVITLFVLKSPLKWITFFLAPYVLIPVYWFTDVSIDYFRNEAVLYDYAKKESDFSGGLDREYRAWRVPVKYSYGHHTINARPRNPQAYPRWYPDRSDEYALIFDSHNSAFKLWTELFGFQKGVYRGYFPTKSTAYMEVEKNGQVVELKDKVNFDTPADSIYVTFLFEGKTQKITWNEYTPCPLFLIGSDLHKDTINTKVCFLNNELEILKISFTTVSKPKEKWYFICLADASTGEVFYTYSSMPH